MTPSRLVPAFSSSCAAALSSTPVSRNRNADVVIVGSMRATSTRRGSDAMTRIGTPAGDEFVMRVGRHQCIPLRQRSPARDPVGLVGDAEPGLRIEPGPSSSRYSTSVVVRSR